MRRDRTGCSVRRTESINANVSIHTNGPRRIQTSYLQNSPLFLKEIPVPSKLWVAGSNPAGRAIFQWVSRFQVCMVCSALWVTAEVNHPRRPRVAAIETTLLVSQSGCFSHNCTPATATSVRRGRQVSMTIIDTVPADRCNLRRCGTASANLTIPVRRRSRRCRCLSASCSRTSSFEKPSRKSCLGSVDKRSFQTGLDVIQRWSLRRPVDAWRPDGRGMGDHWRPAAA